MAQDEIRQVLVPIDFSDASRAAASRAAWIANQLGASVYLVHATDGDDGAPVYGGAGAGTWWRAGRSIAGHELAKKELSLIANQLGSRATYDVVAGKPLAVVREAVRRGRADLIVLGVHAHHSWWHLLTDSTSDRAIRVVPAPVIAVKELRNANAPILRIVAMTDFSVASDAALGFAIQLARGFGARIDVLHALALRSTPFFPYQAPPSPAWNERLREKAWDEISSAIDRIHKSGVKGEGHVVDSGPLDAIAGGEPMRSADLIAMGTRGHTGLKHMVLGSVAQRGLHSARCSVAVVHGVHTRRPL